MKQVGLAYRTWEGDYSDRYPQTYAGPTTPVAPFLTQPWLASGSTAFTLWQVYAVMSNELNNPKIIVCPSDTRTQANDFSSGANGLGSLNATHCNAAVSYAVGKDCDETFPAMMLSSDRNVVASTLVTAAVNPHTIDFGYGCDDTNGYAWSFGFNPAAATGFGLKVHNNAGNVGLSDGSVQQVSSGAFVVLCNRSGDSSTAPNFMLFP